MRIQTLFNTAGMAHGWVRGFMAFLLAVAGAAQSAAQEEPAALAQQREHYFTAVREQDAKLLQQNETLKNQLAKNVEALGARYKDQGNFDGMIATHEILEALEDPFQDVVIPENKNIDDLKNILNRYFQREREIAAADSKARDELKAAHIANLENEGKKLFEARKMDDARAIHNEIQRLKKEQERGASPRPETRAATPADPRAATLPDPRAVAQPPAAQPAPAAKPFTTEAEVIEKLKTLANTTVVFNGRVRSLERSGANDGNFLVTFEGGLKMRLNFPANSELAMRAGVSLLKAKDPPKPRYTSRYYNNQPPPGEDILLAGMRLTVQATIARGGVLNHAAPNSFVNPAVVGSDNAVVRRHFNALCGGPCPTVQRGVPSAVRVVMCQLCGNEQIHTPPAPAVTTIYY